MINYLQLGRNLNRFAPRVEAKTKTFVYDSKGIYNFKQKNNEVADALTNSFRDIVKPILEIIVKKSKHDIGTINIKDNKQIVSKDHFVLLDGKIEEFLPDTDNCIQKLQYDKNGIIEISKQNSFLQKLIPIFIRGLNEPSLELTFGKKQTFSICGIKLKNGSKEILHGYYSESNLPIKINEKIHIETDNLILNGFGNIKTVAYNKVQRLPKKILKRLWMLDERAKNMVKLRYGIDCSSRTPERIAKNWRLTGARVRDIINKSKEEMENADTFCKELNADLDNLGYLLSDEERYKIYHYGSSIDINQAEKKMIIQKHLQNKKFAK